MNAKTREDWIRELDHPWPYPPNSTAEQQVAIETAELQRLEAMDRSEMPEYVQIWHRTAIRDVYWRRRMARMATRTPDQIAKNVCAPG